MLTEHTVSLSGGRHQVVVQAGVGPALVWLHGLYGVTADAPLIEALARQHAVYAPLAPGFADLAELDDLRDIHDLALHYDDVLDALQLEQTVVVGHSFGAMIAAELAAHVPARIARLVLLSPLGLWNDAYPVADLWGVPSAELPTLLYADPSRAPGVGPNPDVEAVVAQPPTATVRHRRPCGTSTTKVWSWSCAPGKPENRSRSTAGTPSYAT